MKRKLSVILSAALVFALLFSAFAYAAPAESDPPGALAPDHVFPHAAMTEPGDANCDGELTSEDARLALRCSVGLEEALCYRYDSRKFLADITGDGVVTAEDARAILRCSVGLDCYEPPRADDGYYCVRVGLGADYRDAKALNALDSLVCAAPEPYPYREFPLWRIGSAGTLQSWLNAYRQDEYNRDCEVNAFLRRYGDAFFEEYDLFICYQIESSGSYIPVTYLPVLSGSELRFSFARAYMKNAGFTCDMADWLQFVAVKKSVSQNAASFSCTRGADVELEWAQLSELLE